MKLTVSHLAHYLPAEEEEPKGLGDIRETRQSACSAAVTMPKTVVIGNHKSIENESASIRRVPEQRFRPSHITNSCLEPVMSVVQYDPREANKVETPGPTPRSSYPACDLNTELSHRCRTQTCSESDLESSRSHAGDMQNTISNASSLSWPAQEVEDRCFFSSLHKLFKTCAGFAHDLPLCCRVTLGRKKVSLAQALRDEMCNFCMVMAMSMDWQEERTELSCMLDSAADMPLMGETVATNLGFKRSASFDASAYMFETVTGQVAHAVGKLTVPLKMQGSRVQIPLDFLVVADEIFKKAECLLGKKVIKRFHLTCRAPLCMTRIFLTLLAIITPIPSLDSLSDT